MSHLSKEGTATNLDELFTKMFVHIRHENLLDKFMHWFIWEVVLSERQGSCFLPKKGFTTSSISEYGAWIRFFCMGQVDPAIHQHIESLESILGDQNKLGMQAVLIITEFRK